MFGHVFVYHLCRCSVSLQVVRPIRVVNDGGAGSLLLAHNPQLALELCMNMLTYIVDILDEPVFGRQNIVGCWSAVPESVKASNTSIRQAARRSVVKASA